MKHIIGIDPGLGGALTIISGIENPKIQIFDTPTCDKILKGKKKKKGKYQTKDDYDKPAMAEILRSYTNKDVLVSLEAVHAMPGQGSVSMFGFGRGTGIWEGMIAAFGFNLATVSPTEWKKEWGDRLIVTKPKTVKVTAIEFNKMSLAEKKQLEHKEKETAKQKRDAKKAAKKAARDLASELYPSVADMFKREKDDGRAESLLMAERIRRMLVRGEI
jgi:hypothetical protein